ncbi:unnamed protein product [Rotaria sordida]|uniref:Uncharacterized protein n=1 Tax=Rotaria sordida TaxID=392033 RepID=A0A815ZG67_9BILA|nr:unnamed protein product [Rotaria sordida]CAF1583082.1 unnamed protein product [Rotaria sordida]
MKILDEYDHSCNLTYLTINSYNCGANQGEYQSMINSIWSLPKLIKCSFNTYVLAHTVFQIPTNIPSSLESASIPSHGPELNQLHTLIECTPCLNRLHVKQRTFGLSENIIQERADKLLKSFQTSFWTNQHQWIKFPLNDQFWSIVPSLNRLETLVVYSHADSFQSQLQVLLDRAPNLRCLDIRQDESLSLQMSLFQYRTSSVRQLDFRGYNYYVNEEECIRLCHSPLCIQCGVLFIRIKSRHSTIYLVKNMINLRSLHVKRDDEKYHKR